MNKVGCKSGDRFSINGGVPKWLKGPDSKSGRSASPAQEFESLHLRQIRSYILALQMRLKCSFFFCKIFVERIPQLFTFREHKLQGESPMNKRISERNKCIKEIDNITIRAGRWKIQLSISDIIQITVVIISLCSFIGVICTLREMQKDRDAAYRPTILMNPEEYQISWNSSKEEEWLSSLPDEPHNTYEINEDGSVSGTGSIPMNIFPENELEGFTVVNVGVGVSKDIHFKWDDSNIENLSEYLSKCDPTKSEFCTSGKSVAFSFEDRVVITDIDRDTKLMYMLADASETYTIPLPMAYSILIHEIMKTNMLEELPYIILSAEYTDIQGKAIKDYFYVTIQRTFYQTNEDGSGSATYQLNPTALSN